MPETEAIRTVDHVVRVLIVDDSAYVRKVVRQMLARSPFIEVVGAAHDGDEALEMVERLRPDVIVCDLIMPNMDGVSFIREQMARRPVPVVVLSIANDSSERALAALDAGAIDFVRKPTALATEKILEVTAELVDKVKAAASVPLRAIKPVAVATPPTPVSTPAGWKGTFDAVVIGISTGGPQALKVLVPSLPANCPVPIAIVMHMPAGYIDMYASKLNEMSPLAVKEAEEGDELRPGVVLLAPSGHHLSFRRDGERVLVHLDLRPVDTTHRPSVDVLFQSASDTWAERVLAVVMTGMGCDGRDGAAWVKAKGGRVLTEAEQSCVIYGMPRCVVEAGLSDQSVALGDLASTIVESL
ncbi:MAG: chemotaxis-specific protein-glutamate methyltransferase CheB [Bacteroidales bacterium]